MAGGAQDAYRRGSVALWRFLSAIACKSCPTPCTSHIFFRTWRSSSITQPQCVSVGMRMRLPTMWVPGTRARFVSVLLSSLAGRVTS